MNFIMTLLVAQVQRNATFGIQTNEQLSMAEK